MTQIDSSHRSPNHSARTSGGKPVPISMLVIHATAGSASSALSWLCSAASRVSAHYLIGKDGHTYQLVSDDRAAWHAGKSRWMGLNSNDIQCCSIGIELENANSGIDPYPQAQLAALIDLCREKVAQYHIAADMVVRHAEIAIPKGRKTDPAGFPWQEFLLSLSLQSPEPAGPVTRFYRVVSSCTLGARVRAAPTITAESVDTFAAGTLMNGSPVDGQTVYVAGFGKSNKWLKIGDGKYIWAGLVELA